MAQQRLNLAFSGVNRRQPIPDFSDRHDSIGPRPDVHFPCRALQGISPRREAYIHGSDATIAQNIGGCQSPMPHAGRAVILDE